MRAPTKCARCAGTGFAGFEARPASWLCPFGRTVLVAAPCRACPRPGAEAVLAMPAVRRVGGAS